MLRAVHAARCAQDWHDNVESVCGPREWLWLLPVRFAAEGDGLRFDTRQGRAAERRRRREEKAARQAADPASP